MGMDTDHHLNSNHHEESIALVASKHQFKVQKKELVRVILDELRALNYVASVETLEKESGFILEDTMVTRFRQALCMGQWKTVEQLLPLLSIPEQHWNQVLFMVHEQHYLELLEQGDVPSALSLLRGALTPIHTDPDHLRKLSSYLMCTRPFTENDPNTFTVDRTGSMTGITPLTLAKRYAVLKKIQQFVPPETMLSERLLETLLDQALAYQVQKCAFHNTSNTAMSLATEHRCGPHHFPSTVSHIFEDHVDEVWFLAFSNKGDRLASSSKDTTAILFDIKTKKKIHVLSGHQEAVAFLSWSPDDSKLLTCGNDKTLCLWDTLSGKQLLHITAHTSPVTACGWLPDNERFVSGGLDKLLFLWNTKGVMLHQWTGFRINDLRISTDGTRMLACTNDMIKIYDMATLKEIGQMEELESITSINISKNGKHAIANTANQEIHLWDIASARLVRKYVGHKQGKFVIRSAFGGVNEGFLTSGSEDAKVYIWHRKTGHLVSVFSGHTSTVNAVSWNPVEPRMLATCSDDRTVRIWTPETVLQ